MYGLLYFRARLVDYMERIRRRRKKKKKKRRKKRMKKKPPANQCDSSVLPDNRTEVFCVA